jgi:ferredoxin
MRVEIDHQTCLRSGQCFYLHPQVFREGPDGFPLPVVDPVPPELREEAEEAAEICPSGAIQLIEDDDPAA